MRELERYDTSELKAELERRKRIDHKPIPYASMSEDKLEDIRQMCINYVDGLAKNSYSPGDLEHYVFEAAMEATFGVEVWKWINERLR
jgi:hypothetical protein